LLEEMGPVGQNIDPMELLFKVYKDYALPVKTNVDFTRQLETLAKRKSFIAEETSRCPCWLCRYHRRGICS